MTKTEAAKIREMANSEGWDIMLKEFRRMALTIARNSGQSKVEAEGLIGLGKVAGIAEMIQKLEKIEMGEASTSDREV